MRFTKLGHSCVRLEKNGAILVIDPGMFSDAAAALDGAAAVLVTHEHPDHLDAGAIKAALSGSPDLTLWTTPSVTTVTPWKSPVSPCTATARSMRWSTRTSRWYRTPAS
jgi:L-ascorbate metabolism protein UlaG (beta-lactamase superfamily)